MQHSNKINMHKILYGMQVIEPIQEEETSLRGFWFILKLFG